jgi:SAM-dependent methyltransferase
VCLPRGDVFSIAHSISYADVRSEIIESLCGDIEKGVPWRDAVCFEFGRNSWLSEIVTNPDRDLFYRNLDFSRDSRILDVGAGWGQIAIPTAQRANVCALEPSASKIRFMRAVSKQEGVSRNLWFVNSSLENVQFTTPFDAAILNGVLEWVPAYETGDARQVQQRFLRKVRSHLKPGGCCAIGIENRIGLKYLMGVKDDHLNMPLIGIYHAALASRLWQRKTGQSLRVYTYTMAEYEELLHESGFSNVEFFAVLPDYKLPKRIFPLRQPRELNEFFAAGNFIPEHCGADGSNLPNQAELQSLYRSFAEMGIAHCFVPSFCILAR